MRSLSLIVALICAATLPPVSAAQDTTTVEYAAKFVCGRPSTRGPVAPGTYSTAINVHQPGLRATKFRWKLAITGADTLNPTQGPVSPFFDAELAADAALEIDCQHIRQRAQRLVRSPRFLKGFVVIQTPTELDVTAVYTAAGSAGLVVAADIEQILPRRLTRM